MLLLQSLRCRIPHHIGVGEDAAWSRLSAVHIVQDDREVAEPEVWYRVLARKECAEVELVNEYVCSCVKASTGRVSSHHLSSGSKTVRQQACLFHECSLLLLVNTVFNPNPFSWDYLKKNLHRTVFASWAATKHPRVYTVYWRLTTETLHNVTSNMSKRVHAFIAEHGGHFRHLFWDCTCKFNCRIKV
jgi:hypothetical protein